ncbi:MAG: biotin carboxylase [Gemmatimonadota bacterium]
MRLVQASPFAALPGPLAVLHQALDPPLIDGARKPLKEGGYADSGADIAAALRGIGIPVLTPGDDPDPSADEGWTYPDTPDGIGAALRQGAQVLWANTVLFAGHPLEAVSGVRIVGQRPADVHRFDDKWVTRTVMREAGLPFPAAVLVGSAPGQDLIALGSVRDALLADLGMGGGAIVKPVRGRGSQGVSFARSAADVRRALAALFEAATPGPEGPVPVYGSRAIVEQFLVGEEITVTVLPPGTYRAGGRARDESRHWALPAIRRTGHAGGIAPYSGIVPVAENSVALPASEARSAEVVAATSACIRAAELIGARAPVRVDCRRGEDGRYMLFDVNLKPNLTGPGRPGREQADSLVSLAGRAAGWSYPELLREILQGAWLG